MVRLHWHIRAGLTLIICAAVLAFFALSVPGFLRPGNIYALLQSFAALALVAAGLATVMIAGEFDLSIAGALPLAAVITVKVAQSFGLLTACAAALLVSALVGLTNGLLTSRTGISSLAITVGTMVLTIGLGFAFAADQVVVLTDYTAGMWLDQRLAGVFSPSIAIQLLLVLLLACLAEGSWFGVLLRAVGDDRGRAKSTGVPVFWVTVVAFTICSALVGVAGIIQGLSLASGSPGQDTAMLLRAATAAIVGGVSLTGGIGQIYGVAAAALLLAAVSNGLSLEGASESIVSLINGGILLFVVVIDRPLDQVMSKVRRRGLHVSSSQS